MMYSAERANTNASIYLFVSEENTFSKTSVWLNILEICERDCILMIEAKAFHWCDTIVKSTTCGLAQLVCILKKNIKLEAWMVSVKLMTRFFFPIDHNFDNLYEHANSPNQCSKSSKGTSRRERRERKKKHNILSTKWGN